MIVKRCELHTLLPIDAHVAEIGVAEGRFSLEILQWGNPPIVARLYLVDLWQTKRDIPGDVGSDQHWHDANVREMKKNLTPYQERVFPLRGMSHLMAENVPDSSLDLVYLDACHDYEWVKKDLEAWYPKVKPGAIVAGHDFLNTAYGVKRAVDEFASARGLQVHLIPELQQEDAGFWFRKEVL